MGLISFCDSKKDSNPNEIKYLKEIVNDSFVKFEKTDSFCIFMSINEIFYLIYSTKKTSIIFYDIIMNKKIIEIKNAHKDIITGFTHYLDNYNKIDLIISISYDNNNIKLWNVNNFTCILNLDNINESGRYLSLACFLNDKNQIYIITGNRNLGSDNSIKIFDLKGKMVKQIKDLYMSVGYIDIYYDDKQSKIFILIANEDKVISYYYNQNKIYQIYEDEEYNKRLMGISIEVKYHNFLTINKRDNKEELIELCNNGNIRIWNFHTGLILNDIILYSICNCGGCSLCFWEKDYLFVGCTDKTIKLLRLKDDNIIQSVKGHNNRVICMKRVNHPKYGEVLASQGLEDDVIKLWINKKINNL